MAKKKTDKETEPKKISKNRFTTFFKSETTHFVIGLISVIFSVYLLLAFISFFFTGAADQSILDNQQPGELMHSYTLSLVSIFNSASYISFKTVGISSSRISIISLLGISIVLSNIDTVFKIIRPLDKI